MCHSQVSFPFHVTRKVLCASSRAPHKTTPARACARGPRAPLAAVAGGFLIPPSQYSTYSRKLDDLGCATLCYTDASTLTSPTPIGDGAASLLGGLDELSQSGVASLKGVTAESPLVLWGHSRGCKMVVEAAAQSQRRVAAMVLVDPVDAVPGRDPSSCLNELAKLDHVPTLILGTGGHIKDDFSDCAPTGCNYEVFADALAKSRAPRLLGVLGGAGHTQFVDQRGVLLVDICRTGTDSDSCVHDVTLEATERWVAAATSSDPKRQLRAAAAALRKREFGTSVQWEEGDLV